MALAEAKFSGHMAAFIGNAAITDAFPHIKAREVNVLKEDEFPLLAYWVERGELDSGRGSDKDRGQDVTYQFIVAKRLESGEAQDIELGKLVKVVRDLAGTIQSNEGAEFVVDDWDTVSDAENGDGSLVWAAFTVTVKFARPRDDY